MRILLVDDSETIRTTLRGYLQTLRPHAIVQEAGDVESAIEALRRETFDVVFLDLVLPHRRTGGARPTDGDESTAAGGRLVWELLARRTSMPRIVLTTAYEPEHPDARAILANGKAIYLAKPLRSKLVEDVLLR